MGNPLELSLRFQPSLLSRQLERFAWLRKGALAVIDQALFAGSNFVINILLARWLSPAEYGAFALAFSVLLLVGAVHSAALTEPMMVFAPGKFADGFRKYLGVIICGHFGLTVPIGGLLVVSGLVVAHFGSAGTGSALIGAGIAVPLVSSLWLARLACYVDLRAGWSVAAGSVYFAVLMSVALLLSRFNRLSPFTAFLGMGLTAFFVALLLLAALGPRWSRSEKPRSTDVAREHWRYGRWSIASVALNWLPGNIYYLVLPACFGLAAAGALRAVLNLALPVLHCVAALSMVLMPTLVRDRDQHGVPAMNRTMKSHFALLATGTAIYAAVLWNSSAFVLRVMYAGRYSDISRLSLLLVGVLPVASAAVSIVGNGLRALERPDLISWCYLAATMAAVLVGIPCAVMFGVAGAVGGMCVSLATTSGVMLWYYRAKSRVQEI